MHRWAADSRSPKTADHNTSANRRGSFMGTVFVRVEEAAKILSVQASDLLRLLEESGIEDTDSGISVLDSPTTTVQDLAGIMMKCSGLEGGKVEYPLGKPIKDLPAKAAANALKKLTIVETQAPVLEAIQPLADIAVLAQALKPIQQWDDKSLLEHFISTRSEEFVEELDRRAKHKKFVVLKDPSLKNLKRYEPGQEDVDVDTTLKLLKDTRKGVVPGIIPVKDGVAIVYRITELNPNDRIVELCPLCGEIFYRGYCPKCELDFSVIGDDERAYVKLVSDSDRFDIKSHSDRKAVHASASKGMEDLRITWPSIAPTFEDLKLTNSLPKLRMIKNIPATQVADPFHVSGHRSF